MDRSTSRRYGLEIGNIKLTPYDLQMIRDHAITALLNEQGSDIARAWVSATIGYLISSGALSQPTGVPNKSYGEQV